MLLETNNNAFCVRKSNSFISLYHYIQQCVAIITTNKKIDYHRKTNKTIYSLIQNTMKKQIFFMLLLMSCIITKAQVRLQPLFTDNMVLQQQSHVPITNIKQLQDLTVVGR